MKLEEIRDYGLPQSVARQYKSQNVRELYQWQADLLPVVLGRQSPSSTVYCAPTSGGKTLIAELACIKHVCLGRKAIFIVPYVSVVIEKEKDFKQYTRGIRLQSGRDGRRKVKVDACYGDHNALGMLRSDIVVCTIDKANQLINAMLRNGRGLHMGCVVLDEMHLLGDEDRGASIEMMLTKLLFFKVQCQRHGAPSPLQLINMSATVGNVDEISHWFSADLDRNGPINAFVTPFRPVQLHEYIVRTSNIYRFNKEKLLWGFTHKLSKLDLTISQKAGSTVWAALSGARQGLQVLVFAGTRKRSQEVALQISKYIEESGINTLGETGSDEVVIHDTLEARAELASKLAGESISAVSGVRTRSNTTNMSWDEALAASVKTGVAFHHAGMAPAAQQAVLDAFTKKVDHPAISILVATTALAAGVNLPVGRVVIADLKIAGTVALDGMRYRQMIGRAGRAGKTTLREDSGQPYAEAYTICSTQADYDFVSKLTVAPLPDVRSQADPFDPAVDDMGRSLLRSLLEIFALRLGETRNEVLMFVRQTLLYRQSDEPKRARILTLAGRLVDFLLKAKAIAVSPYQHDALCISRYGHAVVEAGFYPDHALLYYSDAYRAINKGMNMHSRLHTYYLVAPLDHRLYPDIKKIWALWGRSKEAHTDEGRAFYETCCLIGIDAGVVYSRCQWESTPPCRQKIDSATHTQKRQQLPIDVGGKGGGPTENDADVLVISRCRRLCAAMVLRDLLELQVTPGRVATEWGINDLSLFEHLLRSTRLNIGRMERFLGAIGWHALRHLVLGIQDDFASCEVDETMLPFLTVAQCSIIEARLLVKVGLRSIRDLASARPLSLRDKLLPLFPFDHGSKTPAREQRVGARVAALVAAAKLKCDADMDESHTLDGRTASIEVSGTSHENDHDGAGAAAAAAAAAASDSDSDDENDHRANNGVDESNVVDVINESEAAAAALEEEMLADPESAMLFAVSCPWEPQTMAPESTASQVTGTGTHVQVAPSWALHLSSSICASRPASASSAARANISPPQEQQLQHHQHQWISSTRSVPSNRLPSPGDEGECRKRRRRSSGASSNLANSAASRTQGNGGDRYTPLDNEHPCPSGCRPGGEISLGVDVLGGLGGMMTVVDARTEGDASAAFCEGSRPRSGLHSDLGLGLGLGQSHAARLSLQSAGTLDALEEQAILEHTLDKC